MTCLNIETSALPRMDAGAYTAVHKHPVTV
jgi:hypothetical protein